MAKRKNWFSLFFTNYLGVLNDNFLKTLACFICIAWVGKENESTSCGHGLNLQKGGSTIIWFGLTWSLELYQQANARLYRQGQNNTVVVHHIVTKGTVDEDVMTALNDKDMGQASLMEAIKARMEGIYK